jgi:hypothetical protein
MARIALALWKHWLSRGPRAESAHVVGTRTVMVLATQGGGGFV